MTRQLLFTCRDLPITNDRKAFLAKIDHQLAFYLTNMPTTSFIADFYAFFSCKLRCIMPITHISIKL